MSKKEDEARAQLEADDQARQNQSHGPAWTSGQTVVPDPPSGPGTLYVWRTPPCSVPPR